ncbi:MAG: hypothetical protein ACI4MZ_01365 [Christensenellales bacterium]
MSEEKRKVYSGVKITLNSFISLLVATVVLLVGIFVIDNFNAAPRDDLSFWVSKILMGVSTFLIMLSMSNITEESRKKHDKDFIDRVNALDGHYKTMMERHETIELETFLEQINIANKYKAFIDTTKRKLNHTRRSNEKRILALEKRLLLTPQEVWDGVRHVKYHKVTFNQMVAGETDVATKDDEYDLQVNKGKYTLKKLGVKAVTIIACSAVVVDFAFHFNGFTKDMIMPLIFKVVSMLIAVYSGVSFGYSMMERRRSIIKKKLRIFSQFRARIDEPNGKTGDVRFAVAIPTDVVIEKIRAKHAKDKTEQKETLYELE